ncbi:MAG: hypothetical protein DRN33_06175, partial [Thermoplasmata archaeon]
MAKKKKKDYLLGQDQGEDDNDEISTDEELEDNLESDASEASEESQEIGYEVLDTQDRAETQADTDERTSAEWFVDFDVWQATLETRFGPN